MYELTIRVLEIMDETDFNKYTIQEIEEMKGILEEFKDKTIEVRLHRIKEEKKGDNNEFTRKNSI